MRFAPVKPALRPRRPVVELFDRGTRGDEAALRELLAREGALQHRAEDFARAEVDGRRARKPLAWLDAARARASVLLLDNAGDSTLSTSYRELCLRTLILWQRRSWCELSTPATVETLLVLLHRGALEEGRPGGAVDGKGAPGTLLTSALLLLDECLEGAGNEVLAVVVERGVALVRTGLLADWWRGSFRHTCPTGAIPTPATAAIAHLLHVLLDARGLETAESIAAATGCFEELLAARPELVLPFTVERGPGAAEQPRLHHWVDDLVVSTFQRFDFRAVAEACSSREERDERLGRATRLLGVLLQSPMARHRRGMRLARHLKTLTRSYELGEAREVGLGCASVQDALAELLLDEETSLEAASAIVRAWTTVLLRGEVSHQVSLLVRLFPVLSSGRSGGALGSVAVEEKRVVEEFGRALLEVVERPRVIGAFDRAREERDADGGGLEALRRSIAHLLHELASGEVRPRRSVSVRKEPWRAPADASPAAVARILADALAGGAAGREAERLRAIWPLTYGNYLQGRAPFEAFARCRLIPYLRQRALDDEVGGVVLQTFLRMYGNHLCRDTFNEEIKRGLLVRVIDRARERGDVASLAYATEFLVRFATTRNLRAPREQLEELATAGLFDHLAEAFAGSEDTVLRCAILRAVRACSTAPRDSRLAGLRTAARDVEARWIGRRELRPAGERSGNAESVMSILILEAHATDPESPVPELARELMAAIRAA